MKQLLTFFTALITAALPAQVTLTQTDFPVAGAIYTMHLSDTTGVQPGAAGTNVTWNFSTLNMNVGTLTDSFMTVAVTPYGTSYPQANLAQHQVTPSVNYFVYFDVTASAADRVGNADTINEITYSNPGRQFVFPLSYGTNASDTYYASYVDNASGNTVHVHGSTTTNADGAGTVLLPAATYPNALRVHYTRNELDTIFTSSGFIAIQLTENYYLWYLAGTYYPILNIQTTVIQTGFSTINRKSVAWRTPPLSTPDHMNESLFRIFPNPASSELQLVFPGSGTVSFYSVDGKLLLEKNAVSDTLVLDATLFEPGIVLVVFRSDDLLLRKEIVIAR